RYDPSEGNGNSLRPFCVVWLVSITLYFLAGTSKIVFPVPTSVGSIVAAEPSMGIKYTLKDDGMVCSYNAGKSQVALRCIIGLVSLAINTSIFNVKFFTPSSTSSIRASESELQAAITTAKTKINFFIFL